MGVFRGGLDGDNREGAVFVNKSRAFLSMRALRNDEHVLCAIRGGGH